MIKTLIVSLLCVSVFAKEHFSRIEPYELYTIDSNVNGQVLFAAEAQEGKTLGKNDFITIDDELDRDELKSVKIKIGLLNDTLSLNEKMALNYSEILKRRQKNYEKLKNLKVKSVVEKDQIYYDMANSENQYIGMLKEVDNIKVQLNDLNYRQKQLNKSIKDKHIASPGNVLYELKVQEGDYVTPSTPLATVADVSKGKLTVYLNAEELEGINNKVIYLNGKKSDYKIDRLWHIADTKHLSSYKAVIIVKAPKTFSELVKVEFHDK